MTSEQFRALFPALERTVWLDTPASPPAAMPVVRALIAALDEWRTGEFRWSDWEASGDECRALLAEYLGVPAACVALMGSFVEAAATVAGSLPPGRIVVGDEEYRSNLFPWLAIEDDEHEVVRVRSEGGGVRTEDLIAATTPGTVLVAVSEVLSSDGVRADLAALRTATDDVGAQLFVDVTQSLGALHLDYDALRPDYLAVHGYKWLLCPRGAAWLIVREDHHEQLRPLLPSGQSVPDEGYFGGTLHPSSGAGRCDTSPAWLSWVGARAALELDLALPQAEVERHCLNLARLFREGAREAGAVPVGNGSPSHIVSARVPDAESLVNSLEAAGIRALALGDRLRVGFHYFNDERDVDAVLGVLRREL